MADSNRKTELRAESFRKDNADKPRWSLLPMAPIHDMVEVLEFGAKKYGVGNWDKAPEWSQYYDAFMRHTQAWWAGEDTDTDTGKSHLTHAMCCLIFLAEMQRRELGKDDRCHLIPKASNS